jgi:ubiquinol-cytochrome c reductase subunit 6
MGRNKLVQNRRDECSRSFQCLLQDVLRASVRLPMFLLDFPRGSSSSFSESMCSYSSLTPALSFWMNQSEEEVVDAYPKLRQECRKSCPTQLNLYEACQKRIAENMHGDCEAWYIDLINCVDKCVAPKIFKLTKGG